MGHSGHVGNQLCEWVLRKLSKPPLRVVVASIIFKFQELEVVHVKFILLFGNENMR